MTYQKGFAHAFLIIGLVLALIGALGFVFWQNFIYEEPVAKNEPIVATKKDNNEEKVGSVPDGYELYKDETLGFSFVYPQEWGDLSNGQIKQRPEFGIGTFGEKTKSTVDSNGIERLTVYKYSSFYAKTAAGYEVRYRDGGVVGSDAGSEAYEPVSPMDGTNVYSNVYGDAGFITHDLFFKVGDSMVYITVGDSKEEQLEIAKTVNVL